MRDGIRKGLLLLGIGAGLAGSGALGAPEPEIERNEAAAALRLHALLKGALSFAQARIQDADGDGFGEFPTLTGKEWTRFVDKEGSPLDGIARTEGISDGYRFAVVAGRKDPEFTVYLAAVPVEFGRTGRRTLLLANDGTLWQSEGKGAVEPVFGYLKGEGGEGGPGKGYAMRGEDGIVAGDPRRIRGNEIHAIKATRACQEAASVYKKLVLLDADANGVGEYPASLEAMVDTNGNPLIGLVTTKGIAHGYRFEILAGGTTPENTCYTIAVPVDAKFGKRTFVQANDGICYASPSGAAPPTDYLPSDGGGGSPGGDFVVVQE